MKVIQETHFAH